MSIQIPDFEDPFEETEETVRARMTSDLDPALDSREGGIVQTMIEGMVKEIARGWGGMNVILQMAFPMWAFGVYLDYKAAEYGLVRKPATKAEGSVTFTGTAGTYIPLGSRVSVPSSSEIEESIYFTTTAAVTIDVSTMATVGIIAEDEGAAGNVAAASINYIDSSIDGLSNVTNAAETSGGSDLEEDEDLRQRLLLEITAPQAAGSVSDHIRWMLSIDGVSAATVVPLWDGANTVKDVLLGADNNPVPQSVLDEAQEFLTGPAAYADPSTAPVVAAGAAGTLTGTFYYKVSFVDDSGNETKGGPISSGVTVTSKQISLSSIPVGPTGIVARRIYRATSTSGPWKMVTSTSTLADNTTTTYTDNTASITANRTMPKVNNTTQYLGQAPIGQRVTVDTPSLVAIDIVATITFDSGYSLTGSGGTIAVQDEITSALENYINSRAPGDDIVYNHVLAQFFDVTGVYNVSGLTVEGGTSNVALAPEEVASLGTVTLS